MMIAGELKCPKCGCEMVAVTYKEKEYDANFLETGRVRIAVDNLSCPNCLYVQCVDGDFMATPWKWED